MNKFPLLPNDTKITHRQQKRLFMQHITYLIIIKRFFVRHITYFILLYFNIYLYFLFIITSKINNYIIINNFIKIISIPILIKKYIFKPF